MAATAAPRGRPCQPSPSSCWAALSQRPSQWPESLGRRDFRWRPFRPTIQQSWTAVSTREWTLHNSPKDIHDIKNKLGTKEANGSNSVLHPMWSYTHRGDYITMCGCVNTTQLWTQVSWKKFTSQGIYQPGNRDIYGAHQHRIILYTREF